MSEYKMREEFDAWYSIYTAGWPPGIANAEFCKEVMWQPWKASRAAVVVDLPGGFDLDRDCGQHFVLDGDYMSTTTVILALEKQE